MARRVSSRRRPMPLEEAQRLLEPANLDDAGRRIEGSLTKAVKATSAAENRIRSQVQETSNQLRRLMCLGKKRIAVQDRGREISSNFARHHFGRWASHRIMTILGRLEQRNNVVVAEAEAFCAELVSDSGIEEVQTEIDKAREAFKGNGLLKLGNATNAINTQMNRYRAVIKLIGDITSAKYDIQPGCDAHYHDFERLLKNDYYQLALADNFPSEADAYAKLDGVVMRMAEIRLAPRLATRNICGVAGGFSSGKSSFLNSLFGDEQDLLPTRITPTTSISTYIFHMKGQKQSINVFNGRGGKVEIEPNMFQEMTHDFNGKYGIHIKHLVDRVSIYTPKLADWKNVVLVDTPGYTNPDEVREVDNDQEIALRSILQSQFLIWLVDCEKGTLPERDVKMIRKFLQRKDRPKGSGLIYLVVNKADKKLEDQRAEVLNQVAKTVKRHGIPYFGIGLYSAHEARWYGHEGKSFADFLSEVSQVDSVNIKALRDQVDQVFDEYAKYHEAEQEQLALVLGLMGRLLLRGANAQQSETESGSGGRRRKVSSSKLDSDLDKHMRSLKGKIEEHKKWSKEVSSLRVRFLRSVDGFVQEIDSLRNVH